MTSPWVAFPLALLTIGLLAFVFVRLRLQTIQGGGRAFYITGGVLVSVAVAWNAVASLSSYPTWFVITAYPALTASLYALLALGIALLAVGLTFYADHHDTRREELKTREERLDILQTLQQDTRAPYQLLELLNMTLREVLLTTPERAGAVFLINRGKRQLILGASAGLTKNETAYLEHLSLDRNVVAQACDLGDPMIAGAFEFFDSKGHPIQSRFQSTAVLPLISGMERIGAVVLLAEEGRAFSRVDIQYLAPVAEWLAEKIRSARLARDLSMARNELEQIGRNQQSLFNRLTAVGGSLSTPNGLGEFCRQLVGLASCNEVHVCGLVQGNLQFYGGSEPLTDFTEQYKTALFDALNRHKPLIINHEAADKDGHSTIVRSSLLYPLSESDGATALLLRKEGSPFAVSEQDLKLFDFFGHLAKLALSQRDISKRDLARRVGFDKVLQLIGPLDHNVQSDPGFFMRHMADILPPNSQAVTFVRREKGMLIALDGLRVSPSDLTELAVEPGEGALGQAAANLRAHFAFGKKSVLAAIEEYEPTNRHALHRLFGERRLPTFLAICPLVGKESLAGIAVFFLFDVDESERIEWERLLTLAAALFSLRLSMADLAEGKSVIEVGRAEADRIAPLINQLNNHLSAVIGNADLAASRDDVSGELQAQLKSISVEAERAAQLVKTSLVGMQVSGPESEPDYESLNDVIDSVLLEAHISGDLFMVGGRPREIDMKLGKFSSIPFASKELRQLFEALLNRFAAVASDEDVFTISTYQRGNFVYLDLSRHHKNFPPVEPVATFGSYQTIDQALQARPADVFLKPVAGGVCFYAFDSTGPTPAYLSFKFPLKSSPDAVQLASPVRTKPIRVLAIDDQEVILDLIAAMCQSLGFEVQTASNGADGLRLAASSKYDVILTDLAMPDMTGLEVARQIRRSHPDAPIILVTGWESGLDSAEVAAAGISEVLLKPFRIEQLTEIVRSSALRRSVK